MVTLIVAINEVPVPRQRDYLFRRRSSPTWYCRLQYRGEAAEIMGVKIEDICLRTSDRAQAELAAMEHIQRHKLFLLMLRAKREGTLKRHELPFLYEPGREHLKEDGTRVIATPEKLIVIDAEGKIVEEKPNPPAGGFTFPHHGELEPRKPAPRTNQDDEVIRTWIVHQNINQHLEAEAWRVWRQFLDLTGGKRLKDCTRDDGRKLAQALLDAGQKRATVVKKIGHLSAAVNLAIEEKKLNSNPFSKVVPARNDELERLPLDDDDMDLVRQYFGTLTAEDRLLWVLLASTGMRLSEAFHIREEFRETGIRYVMVGSKTDQSRRKVPLPEAALRYLPAKITGPLFTDAPKNLGRHLNRFLRRIGITDARKVLHSLRHRAKDRLRAVGCPLDVQYELLGHEEKTVAAGYGKGSPMTLLKHWLERAEGW